jgi:hypothetical protein
MADEERTGTCVVCQQRDPLPELVPGCGPCRSRLAGQLRDIPELCRVLGAGPRPELSRDGRSVSVFAGPVPGLSNAPRVRGSRDRSMPIKADATDLLDIADERMVSDYHHVPMVRSTGETRWQVTWFDGKPVRQELRVREVVSTARASRCRCGHPELHERTRPVMVPAADQVGQVSVASVLNAWVRDFAERRREVGAEPVVPLLCRWLFDRLDWAFTEHDAVDEFAGEVDDVWHGLRSAAGLPRPQPELCAGVPCRSVECDLKTLYRVPGSDYIECASCGNLLTEDEYRAWVALSAAPYKTRR